jgi:hypothetical protein
MIPSYIGGSHIVAEQHYNERGGSITRHILG